MFVLLQESYRDALSEALWKRDIEAQRDSGGLIKGSLDEKIPSYEVLKMRE